jgi:hypothetical protein
VSLYRNPSYAIPRYLLDETDTIPFGLGTVLSVDGDQVKLGTRHHSLGNLQSVDLDEFAAAPGKGVWMSSAGVIAILFVITLLPSVETSVLPILVMGLVTVIAAFLVLRPASKTNRLYEGEVHVVRLNRGSGKRPVFATLNGEAAKGIEEWFKSAMRLYRRPVI